MSKREMQRKIDERNRSIDVERMEWEHLHCAPHQCEACPLCTPPLRIKTTLRRR